MAEEPFLSRWSKRKTEARAGTPSAEPAPAAVAPPVPVAAAEVAPSPPPPLPPVESLTPESDFTGFMRPEVDEGVKRQALKALFQDPRYNEMDGLDVYISDFSLPDPIPESWLGQLRAMARLGAYEEKPEEEAAAPGAEGVAEGPKPALADPEKPLGGQGLAPTPSSNTSDTVDGEPKAPEMPE